MLFRSRCGVYALPLAWSDFAARIRTIVGNSPIQVVGSTDAPIDRVAVGCGSGGSFWPAAQRAGATCLITGEATFHTCLEAVGCGMTMVLVGHYESERFSMETLAQRLQTHFGQLEIWASQAESSTLRWMESR